MEELLQKSPSLEACQSYVDTRKTTLLLKGAPTFLFHPGAKPLIITAGDPGMATAGSGDVLTGLLAGLLAQKIALLEATKLGSYLHAKAGELAAAKLTSYGMIASDITAHLPQAYQELL
jgi:NAD(P)H-hydrate epimerase